MSALCFKYCQRYASSLGIGWGFPASWLPFGGGTAGPIGSMASRGADRSPAEKISARDFNWRKICAKIQGLAILPATKERNQAMLDLVPTNSAIRPSGDGWEYRHNDIADLSLYEEHGRVSKVPIDALTCCRPGQSATVTTLCRITSYSRHRPRN